MGRVASSRISGKIFFDLINAANFKSNYFGGTDLFSMFTKMAAMKKQLKLTSTKDIFDFSVCEVPNTFTSVSFAICAPFSFGRPGLI
jgi:hypothetical protein